MPFPSRHIHILTPVFRILLITSYMQFIFKRCKIRVQKVLLSLQCSFIFDQPFTAHCHILQYLSKILLRGIIESRRTEGIYLIREIAPLKVRVTSATSINYPHWNMELIKFSYVLRKNWWSLCTEEWLYDAVYIVNCQRTWMQLFPSYK